MGHSSQNLKLFSWISINHKVAFSTVQHGLHNFYKVRTEIEEIQTLVDKFMVYGVKSFREIDKQNHARFLVEVTDGDDFQHIEYNLSYIACILICFLTT